MPHVGRCYYPSSMNVLRQKVLFTCGKKFLSQLHEFSEPRCQVKWICHIWEEFCLLAFQLHFCLLHCISNQNSCFSMQQNPANFLSLIKGFSGRKHYSNKSITHCNILQLWFVHVLSTCNQNFLFITTIHRGEILHSRVCFSSDVEMLKTLPGSSYDFLHFRYFNKSIYHGLWLYCPKITFSKETQLCKYWLMFLLLKSFRMHFPKFLKYFL